MKYLIKEKVQIALFHAKLYVEIIIFHFQQENPREINIYAKVITFMSCVKKSLTQKPLIPHVCL